MIPSLRIPPPAPSACALNPIFARLLWYAHRVHNNILPPFTFAFVLQWVTNPDMDDTTRQLYDNNGGSSVLSCGGGGGFTS